MQLTKQVQEQNTKWSLCCKKYNNKLFTFQKIDKLEKELEHQDKDVEPQPDPGSPSPEGDDEDSDTGTTGSETTRSYRRRRQLPSHISLQQEEVSNPRPPPPAKVWLWWPHPRGHWYRDHRVRDDTILYISLYGRRLHSKMCTFNVCKTYIKRML